MDLLKGKVVNVVLTVQEGRGMEAIRNLALITANLSGRILESDPVKAEDCPCFNTNLIWEIEKKDLRKIRSSNQPLRVECFNIDVQNHKEKFGHLLLDLRCAQVVDDQEQQVPFKWAKLLGVRNKKRNSCPELYLSLTIRGQEEAQKQESFDEFWEPDPRPEGSIPIQYLEDGYIMVGNPEKCTDDYSLNILIKSAASLDLLLPEMLVFHQNNNKYCMCIKILGIPIKTKQFSKDLHERILFEEKIVVRLLSNLEILHQFFREETFDIGFNCGSELLGITTVSFDGLTNLNEKLILAGCFFRFPSTNGIVPIGKDGRKPFLSLEIFLTRNREDTTTECMVNINTVNSMEDTNDASGDHNEERKPQLLLITEEHTQELENWKKQRKLEFEEELKAARAELSRKMEELRAKKAEMDDSAAKYKEMQEELQDKLVEAKFSKTLLKKQSSSELQDVIAENQKKFGDCDKELLIDYISALQKNNDNLKTIISNQKQELANMRKTALTKEQTTNLLQELKGLEEKFALAQQAKTYFKDQWKRACEEIHDLKSEDYKLLQDQLRERREELDQLEELCVTNDPYEFI